MKKMTVYLIMSSLVIISLLVSAYSYEEMARIDNSDFPNPERVPSIFDHDNHNEAAAIEECNLCHHVYENGTLLKDESSEDQRCSECHEIEPSGNSPSLMNAYHLRCKGCHMAKKIGPVMCGECHLK